MIASGKLKGINVTVGAQNFSFIGGSVGSASGEAFICMESKMQLIIKHLFLFLLFWRTTNDGKRNSSSANG